MIFFDCLLSRIRSYSQQAPHIGRRSGCMVVDAMQRTSTAVAAPEHVAKAGGLVVDQDGTICLQALMGDVGRKGRG